MKSPTATIRTHDGLIMNPRARAIILALALAGLAVSVWATVIHHRLLTDPSYISPCDINASFSCSHVYLSPYGSISGVPVALGGVIWFGLVALAAGLMRPARGAREDASGSYVFPLACLGLAAIVYLAYVSFVILRTGCVFCLATYVCVLGIFAVSSRARSVPMRRVPQTLARDLRGLASRPVAATTAAILIAATGYLALTFPRSVQSPGAVAAPNPSAAGASSPADPRQAFEAAWTKQPRVDLGIPAGRARVVVVKFLDWQCPTCRLTEEWYRPIIAHFEELAPGDVKYVEKDFPLDPKCNFLAGGPVHPAPCEAAGAVRMAAERGKRDDMVRWVLANQSANAAAIRAKAQELTGLRDFDNEYAKVLPSIRQDVSDGAALHVHGTPTIFVNGVECPPNPLPASYFQMAIEYELRASAAPQ